MSLPQIADRDLVAALLEDNDVIITTRHDALVARLERLEATRE